MSPKTIRVEQKVLAGNDAIAQASRERFDRLGIAAVNLIASPGAGKTTLLTATIGRLKDRLRIVVVEGDQATTQDADRIAATGVPVHQIETGGACHLSARQVAEACERLPIDACDLLLIENVGNLVCPTAYDLGEHAKVALLSTPEGDDKPTKYPGTFAKARVIVVTKADLTDHVDFDLDRVKRDVARLNPDCQFLTTSAKTGAGMDAWCDWLVSLVDARRVRRRE